VKVAWLRRVIVLLASLLLGTGINFVVASLAGWNHVVWIDDDTMRHGPPAPRWVESAMDSSFRFDESEYRSGPIEITLWYGLRANPFMRRIITRARWGWPLLAFESRRIQEVGPGFIGNPYADAASSGIELALPEWVPKWIPRAIKLGPVWPGLLVNSLLFGFAIWFVWLALRRARLWLSRGSSSLPVTLCAIER
jgi:hypothetical protein